MNAAQEPLLIAKNLAKSFTSYGQGSATEPFWLFQDISLTIYPNETLAIIGASGEGKSTLLQILGLLEKPSSGSLDMPHWRDLSPQERRARHLGFIFQQFLLLEDLSVLENVLLPMRIANVWTSKKAMHDRAFELIERVGLTARAHHPASRLSGGEKQRCAIARALINNPSLLMADEPTGNLDHDNAQKIADLLFEIAHERSGSLLLVTHELRLAKRAGRVLRLEKGQLQEVDLRNAPSE